MLNIGLFCKLKRNVQSIQRKRELKFVLWIRRNVQRELLVTLAVQETSDLIEFALWNGRQQLRGSVELIPEHEGLVLEDWKREGEGGDSHILVAQVDAGVALDVAEDVHGLVEVGDGVCLVADKIV